MAQLLVKKSHPEAGRGIAKVMTGIIGDVIKGVIIAVVSGIVVYKLIKK